MTDSTAPRTSARPKPVSILILAERPVQYLAPLFRRYSHRRELEVHVVFCNPERFTDPGFGSEIAWDVPLLEGYSSVTAAKPRTPYDPRPLRVPVWRRIRARHFDLVVCYGYTFAGAWIAFVAARASGTRWTFVGDNHRLQSADGKVRFGKRAFMRLVGTATDGIAALSVRSHAYYSSFAPGKVVLVPHAVDDEGFASKASIGDRWATRRSHSAGNHDTVFLFVGKLIASKRVTDLIDAITGVPNAVLWIVGSGPEEARLREQAAHTSSAIRFFGFLNQSELPTVYAAADALVLPSDAETFGLVVSEAAAVGLPAIVSDACGVVGSLVVDGRSGLVFPAGDVAKLRLALRTMTGTEVRSTLAEGMRTLQHEWSANANEESFVEFCRTTMARRRQ